MTTTTDPDYIALLRNVLESPNDDLPRLILADWLEEPERAGSVRCGECGGHGSETSPAGDSERCLTCNGTGYVSNGNAERAEFIRLQCEIARIDAPTLSEIASGAYPTHKELRLRERALWAGPSVGSWFPGRLGVTYSRAVHDSFHDGVSALVSRGFVGSIRPTAEQFMQHAAELFREHPITEVVLSGKQPWKTRYGHSWWSETNPYGQDDIVTKVIFDLLDEYEDHDGTYKRYPTREAALAALSDACVRYGRRLAGLLEEYAQG